MNYAVVLTHNRPAHLAETVAAVRGQVDLTVVVDNASIPPADAPALLLRVPDQPPNLAALWNHALDRLPDEGWVALLCDDAPPPPGWFGAVVDGMRGCGAAAGCTGPHPGLKTSPDSDLAGRMPGWAFVLDLAKGLRADESMHWWWCDTDLDFQARRSGGMLTVAGPLVPNRLPNDHLVHVPGLAERAGRDGEVFVAKWGFRPW